MARMRGDNSGEARETKGTGPLSTSRGRTTVTRIPARLSHHKVKNRGDKWTRAVKGIKITPGMPRNREWGGKKSERGVHHFRREMMQTGMEGESTLIASRKCVGIKERRRFCGGGGGGVLNTRSSSIRKEENRARSFQRPRERGRMREWHLHHCERAGLEAEDVKKGVLHKVEIKPIFHKEEERRGKIHFGWQTKTSIWSGDIPNIPLDMGDPLRFLGRSASSRYPNKGLMKFQRKLHMPKRNDHGDPKEKRFCGGRADYVSGGRK